MAKFRKNRRALSNRAMVIIIVLATLLVIISLVGHSFKWSGKVGLLQTSTSSPSPISSQTLITSELSSTITPSYIFEGFKSDSNVPNGSPIKVSALPYLVTYYNSYRAYNDYWDEENDLPALQLVPSLQGYMEGIVFYSQSYSSNQTFTIKIIGTYTQNIYGPGHGFVFYLFLNPASWNISPQYNNSVSFPIYPYFVYRLDYSGSLWVLPESKTPYLMVMWDPAWGTFAKSPNGGQWDVWIINNPNDVNASYILFYGIGTGYISPSRYDYIIIKVTYDPFTNTISGTAYDYNTSQVATFSLNLNGIFTPPKSGVYIFGIGSGTGYTTANWTLLYVNAPALEPLFSPELTKYLNYV